uniref:Uncharacterized protein n=1 Tax=Oryza sativa subsp. japonica TaxID=39947 RepID=Q6Z2D4_ORYSJ|nr:hypothetical protein [Oryza sativa Japonica Group]
MGNLLKGLGDEGEGPRRPATRKEGPDSDTVPRRVGQVMISAPATNQMRQIAGRGGRPTAAVASGLRRAAVAGELTQRAAKCGGGGQVRTEVRNLGRPSPFAADHRSSPPPSNPSRRRFLPRRRPLSCIGCRRGEYHRVRLDVLYA